MNRFCQHKSRYTEITYEFIRFCNEWLLITQVTPKSRFFSLDLVPDFFFLKLALEPCIHTLYDYKLPPRLLARLVR